MKYVLCFRKSSRHDKMSDQQPATGKTMIIQTQIANLSMHFLQCDTRSVGVIGGFATAGGRFGTPELEVGHIDVDDSIEQIEGFFGFISAGVVYKRQVEAVFRGMMKSGKYLRDHMGRGHEINIMTSLFLQGEHHVCKLSVGNGNPVVVMAYIEVLAKKTKQVTAGEEDGP